MKLEPKKPPELNLSNFIFVFNSFVLTSCPVYCVVGSWHRYPDSIELCWALKSGHHPSNYCDHRGIYISFVENHPIMISAQNMTWNLNMNYSCWDDHHNHFHNHHHRHHDVNHHHEDVNHLAIVLALASAFLLKSVKTASISSGLSIRTFGT